MKVDVSLDLYRIFCAVVRTGNMSAAARELFISQPAVSMSIRQLEDRMGSPLLVRTAKGVYPTAEGNVFASARSIGDMNVQLIMEKLGGGGNRAAAAAQMDNISLPEALEQLRKTIDAYLDE